MLLQIDPKDLKTGDIFCVKDGSPSEFIRDSSGKHTKEFEVYVVEDTYISFSSEGARWDKYYLSDLKEYIIYKKVKAWTVHKRRGNVK